MTTPALPCHVRRSPLACVDFGGGGEEAGGGWLGDDDGPGPGAGPDVGPGPAEVAAGERGPELGVLDGDASPDGPADGRPEEADGELEGRCFAGVAFGRSVALGDGDEVIGVTSPIGAPGWVTTLWPAREITAQTRIAPTTTRTSQAEAARR